jgi:hypothetical protein
MTQRYLTPQVVVGIAAGILVYVGFRSLAALIEELYLGFREPLALAQAIFSSLLMPLGMGLIARNRACYVITKIYAWVFVVGNSVMIPLYLTDVLPTAMKNAATVATWLTLIGLLMLLRRSDVAREFAPR